MRTVVCQILIILVLFQSGTRLLVIASYEWNKSYIAHYLCENRANGNLACQGKCYLNKQLKKESHREQSTKSSVKEKYELFFYAAFELPQRAVAILAATPFYSFSIQPVQQFLTDIFHPPC